jgi:dipeptidase
LIGTGSPCTSIFVPVYFSKFREIQLETYLGRTANATFDPSSLWWEHEILYRSVLLNYEATLPLFKEERDNLEKRFIQEKTENGFEMAKNARKEWTERVHQYLKRNPTRMPFFYGVQFSYWNKKAGIQVPKYSLKYEELALALIIVIFLIVFIKFNYF